MTEPPTTPPPDTPPERPAWLQSSPTADAFDLGDDDGAPADEFERLAASMAVVTPANPPPPPPPPGQPGQPGPAEWTPPGPAMWQPPGSSRPFEPLRGLTTWLTIMFGVCALGAVGALVANLRLSTTWSEIHDGSEITGSFAEVEALAGLESTANLLIVFVALFTFATGVVFTIWLVRARANASALGGQPGLAPGWAIGACLAPCLNAFMPQFVVGDIWRHSQPARRRRLSRVITWGVLWTLTALMAFSARGAEPDESDMNFFDQGGFIDSYTSARSLTTNWLVLYVFAAAACAVVVRSLSAMQHERHDELHPDADVITPG